MSKKKKKKKSGKVVQPYKDMHARKSILITGFIVVLVSLVLVLYGALCLFVPDVNFFKKLYSLYLIIGLLAGGVAAAFIGTIFTVAGANTKKSLARLSMFFGVNVFLVGVGILITVLLFSAVIPFPALRRLAEECSVIIPSMLI